jgi:hypothetical protein
MFARPYADTVLAASILEKWRIFSACSGMNMGGDW